LTRVESIDEDNAYLQFKEKDGAMNSISIGNGNLYIGGSSTAYPILFRTGYDNRMIIDTSGNVGIGTTNPTNKLQVDFTSSAPNPTLRLNRTDNRSSAVSDIPQTFAPYYYDSSSANRLSAQVIRSVYVRNSGATGLPTSADANIVTVANFNESMSAKFIGIWISGPNIAEGKTLSTFEGLRIGAPIGSGTVTTKYALVTEENAGNVGIGTTNPVSPLHISKVPASDRPTFQFGDPTATSGQSSASMTFLGTGIENAGFWWVPVSGGTSKLHFSTGGDDNPSGNPALLTIQDNGYVDRHDRSGGEARGKWACSYGGDIKIRWSIQSNKIYR